MKKKIVMMIQAVFLTIFVQGCWAGETKSEISQEESIGPDPIGALKEALRVYGYRGAHKQVPNTVVEFKF